MQCPTCSQHSSDDWRDCPFAPGGATPGYAKELRGPEQALFTFDWMHCANDQCAQVVVRGHVARPSGSMLDNVLQYRTDTWLVHPRSAARPVNPLVPKSIARDFHEAVAILDLSHRMSAVLARRILGDLLEKYASLTNFSLKAQIDNFIADTARPRELRENLHHLREMGDFGAHTQTNGNAEVIDVTGEEASWTLDVVERLFDYFIVAPARDRQLREGIDAKLKEAGRKEIKPLPPDPEVS